MKRGSYEEILKSCGAILDGHFLLTSGLHSDTYIEKFRIFQYPLLTDKLCKDMAESFSELKPHVVVGAATGGIIVSHDVARFLGVRGIFAERQDGQLVFRRGFSIESGERVLVVDDIVTTGGSILELIDLVVKRGGIVIGVSALIDRSGMKIDFGVTFKPLLTMNIAKYRPDRCPLCASNVPLSIQGRTGKR